MCVYICVCVLYLCIDGDQCMPPPCQNGGVCEDGVSTYVCWCKPNFSGKNCEIGECGRQDANNSNNDLNFFFAKMSSVWELMIIKRD